MRRTSRVTTAAEAAARDAAAIADGTPSFELMLRAGTAAAAFILREFPDRLAHGVALFAGSGNNGGDAYVIAAQLARAGVAARLHAAALPRTPDAERAAALAAPYLREGAPDGGEGVVVDGLLGTGHRGALRGAVATAAGTLSLARDRGATLVALDLPSGLDASTGDIAEGSVPASVTLCFGSVKRGVLFQRAHAGRVVVLDIGLRAPTEPDDSAWRHEDASSVARLLPGTPWNAHKGTRGHVALVGGAPGMAGAIVLATRAALASGAGLARAYVATPGVAAVQHGAPQAIALPWPSLTEHEPHEPHEPHDSSDPSVVARAADSPWGDAIAVGPGLGRSPASFSLLQHAVQHNAGRAFVLDADALTLASMAGEFTGDRRTPADTIAALTTHTGQVVLTPHPGEFARLIAEPAPADWSRRAEALVAFAARTRTTVLLKGTPTLIATPDGAPPTVVARGTALLATGGSGDMLTGIIAALLAGGLDARVSAVLGATAHGLASEIATRGRGVRGLTLESVLAALPDAWREMAQPATFHKDILSEFPTPVH